MSICGTFKGPTREIPWTLHREDNKRQHQKREKTQAETQSDIIKTGFLAGNVAFGLVSTFLPRRNSLGPSPTNAGQVIYKGRLLK